MQENTQPTFRIVFSNKKQWLDVFLWDVHPTTFANWKGGRWGYFIAKWENPMQGLFGEIHLVKSRVREDLVAHELLHAWIEWLHANRISVPVPTYGKEEKLVCLYDELVGKFYREWRKI